MDEEPLLLSSLLPPANILIPLSATSKQGAVEELAALLSRLGQMPDKEDMLRLIWDREKIMSTGIGYGIAIPHALSDNVTEPAAALGTKPAGIEYGSLDGKPASIVFLLISPKADSSPHIKILAHLSRVFRHAAVRDSLLGCSSAEDAAAVIREAELRHGQGES
jgi:fructose-specific phosphotransferase system IIA component